MALPRLGASELAFLRNRSGLASTVDEMVEALYINKDARQRLANAAHTPVHLREIAQFEDLCVNGLRAFTCPTREWRLVNGPQAVASSAGGTSRGVFVYLAGDIDVTPLRLLQPNERRIVYIDQQDGVSRGPVGHTDATLERGGIRGALLVHAFVAQLRTHAKALRLNETSIRLTEPSIRLTEPSIRPPAHGDQWRSRRAAWPIGGAGAGDGAGDGFALEFVCQGIGRRLEYTISAFDEVGSLLRDDEELTTLAGFGFALWNFWPRDRAVRRDVPRGGVARAVAHQRRGFRVMHALGEGLFMLASVLALRVGAHHGGSTGAALEFMRGPPPVPLLVFPPHTTGREHQTYTYVALVPDLPDTNRTAGRRRRRAR